MAKLSTDELLDAFKEMTLIELSEFVKENEKLKIKAGLLEGQVLVGKAVEEQLADMPGKNEARAMLLATLQAPAQRLVMLLNTPGGNLVRALRAKEEKG